MKLSLAKLTFILAFSLLAAKSNACQMTIYISNSVFESSLFGPPPSGYGVSFPWTSSQVKSLVGAMTWSNSFSTAIEKGQSYSIRGGTGSYFLVASDQATCSAEMKMYETQGKFFGSYVIGNNTYKLYALISTANQYNVLLEIVKTTVLAM